MARLRIGELLVQARLIARDQLDLALGAQQKSGRKLGQVLIELGIVNETQLTQALSQQLSVPWVSLHHIDFSRELLNLVPRDLAEKYCLVPVFVRRVRNQGQTLYVAMDDPTHEDALMAVSRSSSLPVRPMIAAPTDIRSAIRVYYGEGLTAIDPAKEPVQPPATIAGPALEPAPPPSETSPPEDVAPPSSEVPLSADRADAWPEIEAHTLELPRKPRGPRMVALTLLDGTTIRLPARKKHAPVEEPLPATPDAMTARDLIRTLRAVAQGADASEILGEKVPIEAICAALLSLLLKKGLLADWEFVDELRKT